MRKTKIVFSIIGICILGLILAVGLEFLGLGWKRFFEPKHRNVEREVFMETRSYNEAAMQQLTDYRLQYMQAKTQEEKQAILSTVRLMHADYPEDRLPFELREFLKLAKYGGTVSVPDPSVSNGNW